MAPKFALFAKGSKLPLNQDFQNRFLVTTVSRQALDICHGWWFVVALYILDKIYVNDLINEYQFGDEIVLEWFLRILASLINILILFQHTTYPFERLWKHQNNTLENMNIWENYFYIVLNLFWGRIKMLTLSILLKQLFFYQNVFQSCLLQIDKHFVCIW